MSLKLPPCKTVRKLHTLRSLFVASLWKRGILSKQELPRMCGSIVRVHEIQLNNIADILFGRNYAKEHF